MVQARPALNTMQQQQCRVEGSTSHVGDVAVCLALLTTSTSSSTSITALGAFDLLGKFLLSFSAQQPSLILEKRSNGLADSFPRFTFVLHQEK